LYSVPDLRGHRTIRERRQETPFCENRQEIKALRGHLCACRWRAAPDRGLDGLSRADSITQCPAMNWKESSVGARVGVGGERVAGRVDGQTGFKAIASAPRRRPREGMQIPYIRYVAVGGGFWQNELILEFPTKSMPSGLRAAAILDHRPPRLRGRGKSGRRATCDCAASLQEG